MYKIIDIKTGQPLKHLYKTLKTAYRAADRLNCPSDNPFGTDRYKVQIQIEPMPESLKKEGVEEFFRMPFDTIKKEETK